jgi:hypothetical protein
VDANDAPAWIVALETQTLDETTGKMKAVLLCGGAIVAVHDHQFVVATTTHCFIHTVSNVRVGTSVAGGFSQGTKCQSYALSTEPKVGVGGTGGDWIVFSVPHDGTCGLTAIPPRGDDHGELVAPRVGEAVQAYVWRESTGGGHRLHRVTGLVRVSDADADSAPIGEEWENVRGHRYAVGRPLAENDPWRAVNGNSGGPIVTSDGRHFLGSLSSRTDASVAKVAADPWLPKTLEQCTLLTALDRACYAHLSSPAYAALPRIEMPAGGNLHEVLFSNLKADIAWILDHIQELEDLDELTTWKPRLGELQRRLSEFELFGAN